MSEKPMSDAKFVLLFENRRPDFNFSAPFYRPITPFQKKKKKRCYVRKQLKETCVMGCVRRNLPHSGWLLSQGPGFRPGPQPSPLRPTIWVRFIPTGASPPGPPHVWTAAHAPCTARTTLNTSRAFRGEARAMHLQIKATDFYFSNQTYHSPHVRPHEHCHLWSSPPPAPRRLRLGPRLPRPLPTPSLSSGYAFANSPQQ